MYKEKTFLGIIPARGGSKGLPKKNIKELCGKPLIAWSIEAGNESKYLDEIVVSTDSDEIAMISKKFRVKVPFMRPEHLSNDTAKSVDVIEHVVEFYKNTYKMNFDYVVLLEPTSPLRKSYDIDKAIELLLESGKESIVGICKTEDQNPAFLVTKDESGVIQGYENKNMEVMRRQDINDVFFLEGTIYISKTKELLKKKTFYHNSTIGYVVPKYKSLEIDDMDDFIMVEAIMKYKKYI